MQKRPLGRSGMEVSALCLGSMTWGTQNSEAEGHAQIDAALDAGINVVDTAEIAANAVTSHVLSENTTTRNLSPVQVSGASVPAFSQGAGDLVHTVSGI